MIENPIPPSSGDTTGFDYYREELAREGRLEPSGAVKRRRPEPERKPSDRPNVIWLMADQMRADVFGFAGHPLVQTPNLDRLAQRGMVFHRSYCNSAVCAPARASMMTGRYLNQHGVLQNNFRMNEDEVVFPKLLEEHGYRTACIGKTHCGRGSQMIWDWNMNPADAFGTTVPAATPFHPEHFPEAVYMHHETSSNPNRMLYGKYPAPVEVTKSYRITTEGMKWVYHNDDPRPFLLRLSFDDPHPPVVPPEPYFSMYDPASLPDDLFAQARESLANKPRMVREYNKLMGCEPLTEADHRKHAAVYLGFVSHVDAQMGRFLDYYLRSEFAENTIFIANSDHGHYIGEHGFAGKGVGMHEGVSRIPTIISWPGKLRENAETQALTDGTDLMPTILDLLDLPIPDNIVGRSLAPVLRGESERHKEEVFLQWSDFGCGLVRDRYKLTWYRGDDEGELYDLKNDPLEKNNLFAEPALSEIRENMLQRLQEFREIR